MDEAKGIKTRTATSLIHVKGVSKITADGRRLRMIEEEEEEEGEVEGEGDEEEAEEVEEEDDDKGGGNVSAK